MTGWVLSGPGRAAGNSTLVDAPVMTGQNKVYTVDTVDAGAGGAGR